MQLACRAVQSLLADLLSPLSIFIVALNEEAILIILRGLARLLRALCCRGGHWWWLLPGCLPRGSLLHLLWLMLRRQQSRGCPACREPASRQHPLLGRCSLPQASLPPHLLKKHSAESVLHNSLRRSSRPVSMSGCGHDLQPGGPAAFTWHGLQLPLLMRWGAARQLLGSPECSPSSWTCVGCRIVRPIHTA